MKHHPIRNSILAAIFLVSFAQNVHAAGTKSETAGPDLSAIQAKIDAKDWPNAIADLKALAETTQSADVFNLLGFSLRKSGDFPQALTYYTKALDLDPNYKGAHEYLGELYLETKDLAKANEQLAILEGLCPDGCEERDDLKAMIAKFNNGEPVTN